jgi:hypothetical protein
MAEPIKPMQWRDIKDGQEEFYQQLLQLKRLAQNKGGYLTVSRYMNTDKFQIARVRDKRQLGWYDTYTEAAGFIAGYCQAVSGLVF